MLATNRLLRAMTATRLLKLRHRDLVALHTSCRPRTDRRNTPVHDDFVGDPDRIRTCDPQIRNLMLYPAELRGLKRVTSVQLAL